MGIFKDIANFFRPKKTRTYDAGRWNRLTSDWKVYQSSADSEINSSLSTLRNRSRDLVRNNDYARGAVGTIVRNVLGEGIKFQSKICHKSGKKTLDNRKNKAIEEAFKAWSKPGSCDVTGRLSFCALQQLLLRSVIESGECFVRVVNQKFGDSQIPFALELIEADYCPEERSIGFASGANPSIPLRMGIEFDEWQRPVAYYMYQNHPGDSFYGFKKLQGNTEYNLVRHPASEIIHLFCTERPGQSRGVPWLTSSLLRFRHLQKFEEAELVAARAGANIMGFRVERDGDPSNADPDKAPVEKFEPGMIRELAPGEDFIGFDPNRPNQALEPFVRAMLRGISAGLGVDYASVSRDFSQSNYSSSRLSLLQVREVYRALQSWFIEQFLQPVFERWLDQAVMSGVVNLDGDYEVNTGRYTSVFWQKRGWPWVDPQKDIKGTISAIDAGLTSLTKEAAKQGLDIEEIMDDKRNELQLIKDKGLKKDERSG